MYSFSGQIYFLYFKWYMYVVSMPVIDFTDMIRYLLNPIYLNHKSKLQFKINIIKMKIFQLSEMFNKQPCLL